MPELIVDVPQHQVIYPIKIEKGLLNKAGEEIRSIFSGKKICVITDETVFSHYGKKVFKQLKEAQFEIKTITLPPGEQTKTFASLPAIYSELLTFGLSRSDLILALGGGVVGDIAGFVAASFLRGIDFVQIPTTLLAQVDSSVGGKVGVDLPEGKNLAGAFYHPKLVLIDPFVLNTLSDTNFADGMAEVIKYGCIKDAAFFEHLSTLASREEVMDNIEEIIRICCEMKQTIVQKDEKDKGERMLLNFGHTLGHAIEAYYQYETYSHGQGVAIGMVAITKISEEKGMTSDGTTARIIRCLQHHHLPIELIDAENYATILPYIKKDKKVLHGNLHVVLLDEIGKAKREQTDTHFFDTLV